MTGEASTLTWGQSSEYHHLLKNGLHFPGAVLADVWSIPSGVSVKTIDRTLRSLVLRHETLRTEFVHNTVVGCLDRRQRRELQVASIVHDGDQLELNDISTSSQAFRETCQRLVAEARTSSYEPERFNERIAARVVTSRSGEMALVLRTPHISVDHAGLIKLKEEFAELLMSGSTNGLDIVRQPSQQNAVEQSGSARRRSALAEQYVRSFLASAPQELLMRPCNSDGASRAFVMSEIAAAAVTKLARQYRVSVPTILIAAASILLKKRAASELVALRCPFIGRPYHIQGCIAPQNLPAFIAFSAPEELSLTDLLHAAETGAVRGYRSSGLDPDRLTAAEIDEENRRKIQISGYCQINYLGSPDPVRIMSGDGRDGRPPLNVITEETRAFISRDYQFVLNVAGGYVAGALDVHLTISEGFGGQSAGAWLRILLRVIECMARGQMTRVGDLLDAV